MYDVAEFLISQGNTVNVTKKGTGCNFKFAPGWGIYKEYNIVDSDKKIRAMFYNEKVDGKRVVRHQLFDSDEEVLKRLEILWSDGNTKKFTYPFPDFYHAKDGEFVCNKEHDDYVLYKLAKTFVKEYQKYLTMHEFVEPGLSHEAPQELVEESSDSVSSSSEPVCTPEFLELFDQVDKQMQKLIKSEKKSKSDDRRKQAMRVEDKYNNSREAVQSFVQTVASGNADVKMNEIIRLQKLRDGVFQSGRISELFEMTEFKSLKKLNFRPEYSYPVGDESIRDFISQQWPLTSSVDVPTAEFLIAHCDFCLMINEYENFLPAWQDDIRNISSKNVDELKKDFATLTFPEFLNKYRKNPCVIEEVSAPKNEPADEPNVIEEVD